MEAELKKSEAKFDLMEFTEVEGGSGYRDDPSESEIKKAVEVLVSELNKDDGYRYGWQANIAMAFFDACVQEGIQFPQLHDVSNNAAKQFLRNLCRENVTRSM